MTGMSNALEELRQERKQAQSQVEKLDQAISLLASLNGAAGRSMGTSHKAPQTVRVISLASRRKMAKAQKARWAKAKNGAQSTKGVATVVRSAPAKRTLSAAARKKIAMFQRERWAKLKAAKKAA
jgi:hypothetical protein